MLSRGALAHLVEKGLDDKTKCNQWGNGHDEDRYLANCMANLGVRFADSRDARGRHRFLGDFVGKMVPPISLWDQTGGWLQGLSYYPLAQVKSHTYAKLHQGIDNGVGPRNLILKICLHSSRNPDPEKVVVWIDTINHTHLI